jgi:hypothetical protein
MAKQQKFHRRGLAGGMWNNVRSYFDYGFLSPALWLPRRRPSTGPELKEIRHKHGVGRPPHVNLWRARLASLERWQRRTLKRGQMSELELAGMRVRKRVELQTAMVLFGWHYNGNSRHWSAPEGWLK